MGYSLKRVEPSTQQNRKLPNSHASEPLLSADSRSSSSLLLLNNRAWFEPAANKQVTFHLWPRRFIYGVWSKLHKWFRDKDVKWVFCHLGWLTGRRKWVSSQWQTEEEEKTWMMGNQSSHRSYTFSFCNNGKWLQNRALVSLFLQYIPTQVIRLTEWSHFCKVRPFCNDHHNFKGLFWA